MESRRRGAEIAFGIVVDDVDDVYVDCAEHEEATTPRQTPAEAGDRGRRDPGRGRRGRAPPGARRGRP